MFFKSPAYDMTVLYYNSIIGMGYSKEQFESSKKVIEYLLECNISNDNIIKYLHESDDYILSFDKLPEWLWSGSLLKPKTFYYHPELQLENPPSVVDFENDIVIEPLYKREMKIMYTTQDVLNYYYRKAEIPYECQNTKRDIGSINYLLGYYKEKQNKACNFEPVDVVMFCIDFAIESSSFSIDAYTHNILNIQNYDIAVYRYLKDTANALTLENLNKIVWR